MQSQYSDDRDDITIQFLGFLYGVILGRWVSDMRNSASDDARGTPKQRGVRRIAKRCERRWL